jgi:FAD/FMN-containing dehydrogenase
MRLAQDIIYTTVLEGLSLDDLRAQVHGQLLRPGDAGYDSVRRIWNGMIDRYPAVIVRCADTADVVSAVNFARGRGLPVSVRGGGDNVAGSSVVDDGVMIDLSQMKNSDKHF